MPEEDYIISKEERKCLISLALKILDTQDSTELLEALKGLYDKFSPRQQKNIQEALGIDLSEYGLGGDWWKNK